MRRCLARLVLATGLAGLVSLAPSHAQDTTGEPGQAAAKEAIDAARQINPALVVRTDPATGMPTRVRGLRPLVDPDVALGASRSATGRPSKDDVRLAVEAFFSSGELSAAFSARNAKTRIEALRVRDDPNIAGQSIVQVEQRVDGIPVFGSSARVVVSPSLAVTNLTAKLSRVDVDVTTPALTVDAAAAIAREKLAELLVNVREESTLSRLRNNVDDAPVETQLVVYDPALTRQGEAVTGPARLSWLATIGAFRLFIDAVDGSLLFYYLDQHWAAPRGVFDLGNQFAFPGTQVIHPEEGVKVQPMPADAQQAFDNTGHVLEYFGTLFGRVGVTDEEGGGLLESYVRYGDVRNAYWCTRRTFECPKPGAMVFGETFASALDVVGHEITHGVIAAEANLTYANEPGAVNEALADIFGALIEMNTDPAMGNWVLGESLNGYSLTSGLRNMADPHLSDADGNSLFDKSKPYSRKTNRGQPDHYDEYVKRDDPFCESTSDYYTGCVHINSGIFNKFAFLVSEGGRHRGNVVLGIGRTKLGSIAYRALVTQLTASTGLKDAADAFYVACAELTEGGAPGFAAGDCERVRAAAAAVGLANLGS